MLEPQRSSFPDRGSSETFRGQPGLRPSLVADEGHIGVLSGLRDTIQAGNHQLDTLLECIAEASMNLTGATGAAVAMWKNGDIVCRARAGETAPPLGANLSADSGISGACLRTGEVQISEDTEHDERVDPEVCRRLGLRAMAALPIVGWHGINGIVEVFSTEPRSFTTEQIGWLKQLTALAEKARALQPHTASSVVPKAGEDIRIGPIAPSDGFLDVVLALVDRRRRPVVFGGIGVLVASLLGLAIWLGTRTRDEVEQKAETVSRATVDSTVAGPLSESNATPPRSISTLPSKPSAGMPVTLASKMERLPESRGAIKPSQTPASEAVAIERTPAPAPEIEVVDAPKLSAEAVDSSSLGTVLDKPAEMPTLSLPISTGVSNGQLLRRVMPVYPRDALMMRVQGAVRLEAVVTASGTVENVKAVEGPPLLARAAVDAVKHWRYKPYELNGKPVSVGTSITITFKLP